MAFTKVASVDDLWSGEMIGCLVNGRKVLLVKIEECTYAYEDRCAHLGVALSEGVLDGHVLICGAHHWEYDVRSGRGINPATACLTQFPIAVEAGDILVDVEP